MDVYTSLVSFAAVVGLLTLTPGLDTALILRTSLLSGRASAWAVVLGIQAGTLSWGALTAAGLSALLAASQLAYDILRWAGAVYLVWMGVQMLWHSRRSGPDEAATPDQPSGDSRWSAFRRGLLTNLLNPKVGVFYIAMLPQFMPDDVPHVVMGLLLAGVHVGEGLLWSALLIGFAGLVRGWLRRPSVRRGLDRLTGLVVVGFGLRMAAQQS
ncbi:threonine/homoserine/homoserine lactone efflux protein [Streptosporangium becharense]|uniref:Threonine/homoserine/homoserine lactone efflux protein n=1 Tax=Streptosporangium becharense TaxID=1816182 RepID=A0A7W9IHI3_9ACTN|nr:LysE family translocator [Streptosporangium becharense]MBB2914788.1 threonine/homoserine/homoserine lactone efflux protein [Streptosporangium becharense]MBB5820401.1 threonine/homoserine/homoserine lactone efflux protein [Streptosporangium becharense]